MWQSNPRHFCIKKRLIHTSPQLITRIPLSLSCSIQLSSLASFARLTWVNRALHSWAWLVLSCLLSQSRYHTAWKCCFNSHSINHHGSYNPTSSNDDRSSWWSSVICWYINIKRWCYINICHYIIVCCDILLCRSSIIWRFFIMLM